MTQKIHISVYSECSKSGTKSSDDNSEDDADNIGNPTITSTITQFRMVWFGVWNH